ncbi:MAG: signal peptidase I [Clostridia bacterium]|nr:signal peptidase I [Clostridia bacterium]
MTDKKAKPKTARLIGRAIAIILTAVIVYCCMFCLISRVTKNNAMPMPLGFGMGVVLTGSMEPTIPANSLIFVVKDKTPAVGEIVVYQTGGTPVVHRVIEVDSENGLVITQGDANNAPDDPITLSRIKGRVLFSVPAIGSVFRFVKTVPGTMLILVLIFVILYLTVKSKDEQERENAAEKDLEEQISELRGILEKTAALMHNNEDPEVTHNEEQKEK